MSEPALRRMSVAEYLRTELESPVKREYVTALPSLQTYLMVEQAERRVYVYQRRGAEWRLEEVVGQGQMELPCLGRSLSLDEIYTGLLN